MTTLLLVGGALLGTVGLVLLADRWHARRTARRYLRRHTDTESHDAHRW